MGSISDVYRGVLTSNSGSEDIALKVSRDQDQNSMADLVREARVLRYLKHPNVVGWKGIVIKKDGSLHDSLDKLLLRGKIKALLEVAKGLQYLHHELFHRNIAARNILVKYENNVMITKISDLCLCLGGGAHSRYTMEGSHAVTTAASGLIKAKAIKYEDRPVWFDVYRAFPPAQDPVNQRPNTTPQPVARSLIYPEDNVRAQFFKKFGSPTALKLTVQSSTSLCKMFVDKYYNLASTNEYKQEELFDATCKALEKDGISLNELKKRTKVILR